MLASQYMNMNLKRRLKISYRIYRNRQKPESKYCSRIRIPYLREANGNTRYRSTRE
jgi:hypothetical protein